MTMHCSTMNHKIYCYLNRVSSPPWLNRRLSIYQGHLSPGALLMISLPEDATASIFIPHAIYLSCPSLWPIKTIQSSTGGSKIWNNAVVYEPRNRGFNYSNDLPVIDLCSYSSGSTISLAFLVSRHKLVAKLIRSVFLAWHASGHWPDICCWMRSLLVSGKWHK